MNVASHINFLYFITSNSKSMVIHSPPPLHFVMYCFSFLISNICLHFITEEDGHLAKYILLLDYGIMALALEEKFPVFTPVFLSMLCPFQLVLLSIHLPAGDVLLSHEVCHFWWWVPLSATALGRSVTFSASPESFLAAIPVILQIQ